MNNKKLLKEVDKLIETIDKRIWEEMNEFLHNKETKIFCPFCEGELKRKSNTNTSLYFFCKNCKRIYNPLQLLNNPEFHKIVFKDYIAEKLRINKMIGILYYLFRSLRRIEK